MGTYNCTLTVTNAFGNASFPFTLDITGTPQITAVTPLGGEEGALVTFGATVSGPGTLTYAWDFGGGAAPNTSAAVAPQVTLGAAGSYNATLDVTNEYGSASFPFTLTVTPKTQKPPLELWYFTMQNLLPDQGLRTANATC